MAMFPRGEAEIHYDEVGEGDAILLMAPGGMKSAAEKWAMAPWNPIEQLAPHFRVIAMDQRNAGRSTGPVSAADGWHTYTEDQLALMDHLGIDEFHYGGMCIGGAYGFNLIQSAPDRVRSAVMFQPIGRDANRQGFIDMFDQWADEIRGDHPDVDADEWASFRKNMYGGDEVAFTIGEERLPEIATRMLVLMGQDHFHPESTSRLIAERCPNASLVESWKDADSVPAAQAAVLDFLQGV